MDSLPSHVSEVQFAAIAEMAMGRRGRLRAYVFEFFSAVGFPLLGVSYLLDPGTFAVHSAIGQRAYPWDYVWSVGYVAGPALMLVGILIPRLRMRAIGLMILGTSIVLATVAALSLSPQLREGFPGVYALACFVRAALLIKLFGRYRSLPRIGAPHADAA